MYVVLYSALLILLAIVIAGEVTSIARLCFDLSCSILTTVHCFRAAKESEDKSKSLHYLVLQQGMPSHGLAKT